jgi:hypothetical protein
MRNDLADLTLDDVKVGGESIREPVEETVQNTDEPVTGEVEESENAANQVETPETKVDTPKVDTPVNETEAPEEKADSFPLDRFEGKFKSWEEVETALNEPKIEFKDDFIKKVVDKYNQDGNLDDFFKAYSTDWDKLNDQEVLKREFFQENADMEDEKAIERLWKKELSKYTIDADEYDQEEVETGLALMKRDAKKVRTKFKEEQQSYLQPSTKTEAPDDSKRIEALQKFVNEDPIVKTVKESKIVSLDIDGEKYNFEVDDPQIIADSLVNENLFYNQFVKDGKPDTGKWAEVMAYATNPSKFRKSLVDYGRSLERKSMEGELKNTKLPKQESQKSGSTGDEKEDILNAFVTKGRIVKR